MQEKSDARLLREYAEHGNEAAFCEIVIRHTDLIYSSAMRQSTSPDLARDVTQSVFTDLARKAQPLAKLLGENASILGWLFRSTRFAALNQLRDDRRRQARERQVMENFDPSSETAPEWERMRPILDDAMSDLNEEDRDALLLRFFKNQDFRAVGKSLGVSDDTAQKRVSRALERLRAEFIRRGAATTAAALSTALSANAVTVAPAGLAAALSTAVLAGTKIVTAATATAAKTIAMTTIQKTLITTALAAAIVTGIYGARRISILQNEFQALQKQQGPLADQIRQLQTERDDATSRLTLSQRENNQLKSAENATEMRRLRAEVTRLRTDANNSMDAAAKFLVAKVNNLKQRLEATPAAKIPELQLLTEKDWLNAASRQLDTEVDYRRALASLRTAAGEKFATLLQPGLNQFMQANNGQFPTDINQLQPYLASPVDDAILKRWGVLPAKEVGGLVMGGDFIISEKAPVDDLLDSRFGIGPNGYGSVDFLSSEREMLTPVYAAFSSANNGQKISDLSQLLPYATTTEQQALLQKMIQRSLLDK